MVAPRPVQNFVSAIASAVLVTAVAGCSDRVTLPDNPTPFPPPPPASTAVLAMSNLRVNEILPTQSYAYYFYPVKFLLSETTGRSGATITEVRIATARGDWIFGPACWRAPIRVPPGETLDRFDAGWDGMTYCAPGVDTQVNLSSVSLLVNYVDDAGGVGSVTATVPVTR